MIWISTADGELVYIAEEWEVFTGTPALEAYGMGWLNRIHADDRFSAIKAFRVARSSKQPYRATYRVCQNDGTYRWIKSRAVPSIIPGDGRLLGYCGEAQLVSENTPAAGREDFSTGKIAPESETTPIPDLVAEKLADHLISAHGLAVSEQAKTIADTIEIALYQVGLLLAQAGRDRDLFCP